MLDVAKSQHKILKTPEAKVLFTDFADSSLNFQLIFSLNDSEILSDNKFSLGGRWLRGFDAFGAGPRNSRTSYVGGNNLLALKLDFSKPISLNEKNPIYINIFNDYGTVWGNKNVVNSSDQDLRASYGFGINYYSPIGPIGPKGIKGTSPIGPQGAIGPIGPIGPAGPAGPPPLSNN